MKLINPSEEGKCVGKRTLLLRDKRWEQRHAGALLPPALITTLISPLSLLFIWMHVYFSYLLSPTLNCILFFFFFFFTATTLLLRRLWDNKGLSVLIRYERSWSSLYLERGSAIANCETALKTWSIGSVLDFLSVSVLVLLVLRPLGCCVSLEHMSLAQGLVVGVMNISNRST